MKILLITDNPSWVTWMREGLIGHEVLSASQEEALSTFLDLGPEVTLVNECEAVPENMGEWQGGRQNFRDIRAAATPEQQVLGCGFIAQDDPDFLRLPFSPQDLLAKIT